MNQTTATWSNFNTTTSFVLPFDDIGVILSMTTLIPLCAFGILANAVTIATILTSKKLKLTWYYLIVSLCVSDLLSAIISPLFVYRRTYGFQVWEWSDFLCKMFWSIDTWTSYVTSLHILWFAALRFFSLQWPLHFQRFNATSSTILIVATWIATFLLGFIPFCLWFGAFIRDRSSPSPSAKWPSCSVDPKNLKQFILYTKVVYPIIFYIPIILVIKFSIGIGIKIRVMRERRIKLKGPDSKRKRKENQILLQLILIVSSFLIGYIPRTAFHFYSLTTPSSPKQDVVNWWFGFFEYLLLRISECLNPVFYNLSSGKMRAETVRTIKSGWRQLTETNRKKENNSTVFDDTAKS